ncbi:MAG TPA: prolyl oligopeptidase family serine peptidase [Steroidobacteraceae bacterium]|nr:prolyl oligopeptidase family serine peptidase [Steroidobacteraceae bacterium]
MKIGFDRRQFLAAGAGALSTALLPKRLQAAAAGSTVPPPPVARIDVVRDTYFGETLSDPYRWMENDKDADWLPFLKGQNDHARAVLDALPLRASLLKRVQQLSGDTVSTSRVQRAGGLTFFTQRPLGADNFKLLVRDPKAGADRVLVDPTELSGRKAQGTTAGAAPGHVSLDWWRASPDGRYVVYGLSKDGSEDSTLHILTVADGADLAERIANTQDANPQWLDDGSGFFYNQLTGAVDTPERFLDSQARFHRLGTDPNADPVLMKRGLVAGIDYEKIQSPYIVTYPGSRYAVLLLSDVRPEARAYIAPLADAIAGRARWISFAAFEDEITDIDLDGEDLYLLVNQGTPRGRLVKTSAAAPSLARATEVVPQGPFVIEGTARARDGLYLKIMDGGISRLHRLGHDGRVSDITLPFDGTIGAVYTVMNEDGALISLTGWLTPAGIYSVDSGGRVLDTGITPKPKIDVSAYEAKRFFAAAKDGTKIPYTLIYRKGLKQDGSAPAWISAYGSYGLAAYTPAFAGRTLGLVDAGAIVGYANVRGGGEYGREWHKAGQLVNKPNTWRDLIAVCEDLCAKKYTSPRHLAIGGRSAGGITVGRALTERPDLFAAVVDGVGWSNPLRYVAEQNGYGEEPEWGAISDPNGYRALKSIDSYQSVKDGTPYPAVLLTTGVTDPRVAPFHVAKMAARLQAATSSGKPILLRVDYDAGHGIGSTRSQQDREAADTYAFLLWQLRG